MNEFTFLHQSIVTGGFTGNYEFIREEGTGVSPLAPERALEGGFVTDRIPQIYNHRVMKQSSRWLNSEETLRIMFHEENGRELTADDLRISLGEIYAQLRAGGMETGIPLSEPPELFIEMNEQKIYKLLSVSEL